MTTLRRLPTVEHDEKHWERVSQENVELVRRLYAEPASEGSIHEFEQRMSDEALGRFLAPEIEWVPVTESLLAVDSYRGGHMLSVFVLHLSSSPRRRSPQGYAQKRAELRTRDRQLLSVW